MTVYCGYCGQRGHNRLGCPERKRIAREKPDGYIAKQIKREEETRKRAVANRRCTYCDKPGHNRRGCPTLRQDTTLIEARQKLFIEEFAAATNEAGFAPGALVRISAGPKHSPWSKEVLSIVTGFHWENIDFINQDKSNHYSLNNRKVASGRVVAAKGWDPSDDSYWNQPPRHGEVVSYPANIVSQMLPNLVTFPDDRHLDNIAQLAGPCKTANNVRPKYMELLTTLIKDNFNLEPAKNANAWQKSRLCEGEELWKQVNPEMYEAWHSNKKEQ